MSKAWQFECSLDQFQLLHRAIDATRATSTTVRVPKDALEALLRDHGRLIAHHKLEG